ncbi:MAG: bifunctional phosphoribosyl-AMP cyclohydrolase/phosphoribosyl-ATP diphosphatase HisIE [Phycisphaerales bacterium]|nr:bifunctional phosphoribosyl-AMP cyclohydrolase/phosphoribosyl-ATP diphosphatase HisIE [Phycisphaerales bacterium]
MIIPSIDVMGGKAVQLRQGRELLLTDPRDPVELAREFNRYGPVAVVDLDAALGQGNNTELIGRCCQVAECRVGGGIRSEEDVRNWIKRGARQVVIGTKATPEFLSGFPREWLIAAIDARGRSVVDQGWTRDTQADVVARAQELAPHCAALLFTQVEREGMLAGPDLETARALRAAAGVPIVVAGGIRHAQDAADLVREGFAAQVGRALYEGKLELADVWAASVAFDERGLVPTIVQEARTREVLMLAWSNADSLAVALREGVGCYWSRSRRELWRKGATSGHTQRLVAARWDCDRDCVLFTVEQTGPACHTGTPTCFGSTSGGVLAELEATLAERKAGAGKKSYTQRLLADAELLAGKLREETEEVIVAPNYENLRWECADLIYHLMVRMVADGMTVREVMDELRGRVRK